MAKKHRFYFIKSLCKVLEKKLAKAKKFKLVPGVEKNIYKSDAKYIWQIWLNLAKIGLKIENQMIFYI